MPTAATYLGDSLHSPSFASWGQRVGAWLLDNLIVYSWMVVLLIIEQSIVEGSIIGVLIVLPAAMLQPFWYWAPFHSGERGQTPGKRAVGIAVRDQRTLGRISYWRAVGRFSIAYMFFTLAYIPWIIDSLSPLWDKRNQAWHDKTVSTVVLRAAAPDPHRPLEAETRFPTEGPGTREPSREARRRRLRWWHVVVAIVAVFFVVAPFVPESWLEEKPAPLPVLIKSGGLSAYQLTVRDSHGNFYVANGDGTHAKRIYTALRGRVPEHTSVVLSPDRARIAFFSRPSSEELPGSLMVIDVDGNGLRRLADNVSPRKDPEPVSYGWPGEGYPAAAWSPTGRQIAYSCNADSMRRICLVDVQSGAQRTIATTETRRRVAFVDLDWSPDGTQLALERNWRSANGTYADRISAVSVAGGPERELDWGYYPRWSPDARQIAYVQTRWFDNDVEVMDPDGSKKRRVAEDCFCLPLSWTPDGQRIAYQRKDGIYLATPDGKTQRKLRLEIPDVTAMWWHPREQPNSQP